MSLFGSSGVRGIVNVEFTPELAAMIGMAAGANAKRCVVGTDSRTSGPMVVAAVSSGLMAVGCDVHLAGVVTTPTLAEAARKMDFGVMATASHNPPDYGGLKLWNPDGSGLSPDHAKAIEKAIDAKRFKLKPWDQIGRSQPLHDAAERHVDRIVKGVGRAKLKVVVDCANGPAFTVTPLVLQRMGCHVVTINSNLDGRFPGRPPEPIEENLTTLKSAVLSMDADLGIAHDGDADRMVAIDDRGQFLGGDELLAIFAKKYGKRRVVVTADASMAVDDYIKRKIFRTRVGDVFVSQEVKKRKADFGGEPSGTFIFPDQTYCPDGILAAARLVEIASDKRLSEVRKKVPKYPILRGAEIYNLKHRDRVMRCLDREMKKIKCRERLMLDGYRLQFKDGWALVRPSGTEPKIRMVAEARQQRRAAEIMTLITRAVKRCVD
jgi:phosphoglucosamine mutase